MRGNLGENSLGKGLLTKNDLKRDRNWHPVVLGNDVNTCLYFLIFGMLL
jgi:hypothetical protein